MVYPTVICHSLRTGKKTPCECESMGKSSNPSHEKNPWHVKLPEGITFGVNSGIQKLSDNKVFMIIVVYLNCHWIWYTLIAIESDSFWFVVFLHIFACCRTKKGKPCVYAIHNYDQWFWWISTGIYISPTQMRILKIIVVWTAHPQNNSCLISSVWERTHIKFETNNQPPIGSSWNHADMTKIPKNMLGN